MFSKVIFFGAVIVAVQATNVFVSTGGISTTSRKQDSDGNYAFSYDITDAEGATNSRSEVGDAHGNKQGSYSLHDTDGRARQVDYIADKDGYRAVVKTNEPGTARSAPAAVVVDSPYEEPVAPEVPVVEVPAPVVVAPAPIAHPVPVVVVPVPRPAPVAHPSPVTTTTTRFTIVHPAKTIVAHPLLAAVPRHGVVINQHVPGFVYPSGLRGFGYGSLAYGNGILGNYKGYAISH